MSACGYALHSVRLKISILHLCFLSQICRIFCLVFYILYFMYVLGNRWRLYEKTFHPSPTKLQIAFKAIKSSSKLSDIALDDISVTDGACVTFSKYSTLPGSLLINQFIN